MCIRDRLNTLRVVAKSMMPVILVLTGAWFAYHNQIKRDEIRRCEEVEGVLQAIHVEITVLWERYMEAMGNRMEKLEKGSYFPYKWDPSRDYFTIYNSNAHVIGQIEDEDLRRDIVKAYTLSKALLDSYKTNSELLVRYEKVEKDNSLSHELHKKLVALAPLMRREHSKIKILRKRLLEQIGKREERSEAQCQQSFFDFLSNVADWLQPS